VCIWEIWEILKGELGENRCPPTNRHEREEKKEGMQNDPSVDKEKKSPPNTEN
jgi:hypothetical protein